MSDSAEDTRAHPALEITGVQQNESWLARTLPPVERVRDGLWSIPVPVAIPALQFTNCYVFETDQGPAIVDPGWNDEHAWDTLCAGLKGLGSSVGEVSLVLATHFHGDHLGLAARVREASGAPIGLHRRDAERLAGNSSMARDAARLATQMVDRLGIPDEEAGAFLNVSYDPRFGELSRPDLFLEDGERAPIDGWNLRAHWTPGHTPGHLCYYEERANLLLTGDHVLPKISPNISVRLMGAEPGDNPLPDYLASLRRVADLEPSEVLPGHLWRFSPLSARTAELLTHHAARLAEIQQIVADGAETTWQVATLATWSRPWSSFNSGQQRSALGETLAHLVALESEGALRHSDGPPERWFLA